MAISVSRISGSFTVLGHQAILFEKPLNLNICTHTQCSLRTFRVLIRKFSPQNPVILVAHSLGKKISGYVNVEGNFVMGDAMQLFYKTIAKFVSACEKNNSCLKIS
ncbi:MAG: hypothetical protein HYY43_03215 [Deltaproteobacteria bacterium]|nr:hypothetical protein [Deltaproteobacteria bacterium]MBI2342580.1 hypothetical protein [Deltaproteobacteria bacterium]MBI2974581.1 hypothetical protein [Deltaproteobacteria bacterium]